MYSNGSRRRRKRYRVRYDRVVMAALVFIVLIFILAACAKGCSENKNSSSSSGSRSSSGTTPTSGQSGSEQSGPETTDPSGNPVNPQTTEYTTLSKEYQEINMGDLVLVNPQYEYKFLESDINCVDVFNNRNKYYSVKDLTVMLDIKVIGQINIMMEAYNAATSNDHLRIIGGYRTKENQESRNQEIKGGYSDYHTGRSFDLGVFPPGSGSNYYKQEGNYAWFGENCANYGFIVRYPEGKEINTGIAPRTYTFRYVGAPHAVYMKENDLCLEEYIEKVKMYSHGANSLKVAVGAVNYEIYYVAANVNNVTEIPVPQNKQYTVSGNNTDGFIVTVTV